MHGVSDQLVCVLPALSLEKSLLARREMPWPAEGALTGEQGAGRLGQGWWWKGKRWDPERSLAGARSPGQIEGHTKGREMCSPELGHPCFYHWYECEGLQLRSVGGVAGRCHGRAWGPLSFSLSLCPTWQECWLTHSPCTAHACTLFEGFPLYLSEGHCSLQACLSPPEWGPCTHDAPGLVVST